VTGPDAEKDAGCEIYDQPGQTCLTAGPAVIAAEGACGPCVAALMAQVWDEAISVVCDCGDFDGHPGDCAATRLIHAATRVLPPGGGLGADPS
jgi:homoaconitase/3-isopropylmalate dehydratase large subunit